jgi:hypothetical protein
LVLRELRKVCEISIGPIFVFRGLTSSITGDLLVVVLGCDEPLILRRSSSDDAPATYVVVGSTYVETLRHSAALLGPLPRAYKLCLGILRNGFGLPGFKDLENGTMIYDDPRLGLPLPDEWRYHKKYEPGRNEQRKYENVRTGDVTWRDPRLTSEELRKRGTKVEEFVLV